MIFNEMVDIILDLRNRRALASAKRSFDKKEIMRSKKVELLAKVYDHAKHAYRFGFRMLTLGWSDGSTFLPVNSILLSTENEKNRINEAANVDKRTS